MATYAIGDIHGCFRTFCSLLDNVAFDRARDRLWLVGDLVNRGPRSLQMLRWAKEHSDCVTVVLGNHDFHLLGRYFGYRSARPADQFGPILRASDCAELLTWLASRPLIHREDPYLLVHAGILPAWSVDKAVALARRLEQTLKERPGRLFPVVTGTGGDQEDWQEDELAVQVLVRIRCCRSPVEPLLSFTGPPEEAPEGCLPWFSFPTVSQGSNRFVFGHWARLGFYRSNRAICLDSGCAYGGPLSAIRLDDGQVYQVENEDFS